MSGSGRSDFVSRRSFVTLIGQLAGLGDEQRALGAEDVAQVPVLERGVDVLADVVDRDVELDAAGGVLQRRERGLAHRALEHHAAGRRDTAISCGSSSSLVIWP